MLAASMFLEQEVRITPFVRPWLTTTIKESWPADGGCIAKSEEHHCWLKKFQGGDEGGFSLVFFMNADVVIAPSDVKLHEEGGIFHVVNEFRDKRQRVCILNGVGIKILVVLARV